MRTTTENIPDLKHYSLLLEVKENLRDAVIEKNKHRIIMIYESAKAIDFDQLTDPGFTAELDEYDNLVDQGNEILEAA